MTQPGNIDAIIDAYIDGELSPEDARAFESRLENDPALRRQIDLQRRAEARLKTLLTVPSFPGINLPETQTPTPSHVTTSTVTQTLSRPIASRTWLRAAAALFLVGLLGISVYAGSGRLLSAWRGMFPLAASDIGADVIVNRLVADGFQPLTVCTSPELVAQYTKKELGREVVFSPASGVQLVGWSYANGVLDSQAVVLMATRGTDKIVVFIGKAGDDRRVYVKTGGTSKVHRAAVGGLVFYEVSESCDLQVIDRVEVR